MYTVLVYVLACLLSASLCSSKEAKTCVCISSYFLVNTGERQQSPLGSFGKLASLC